MANRNINYHNRNMSNILMDRDGFKENGLLKKKKFQRITRYWRNNWTYCK